MNISNVFMLLGIVVVYILVTLTCGIFFDRMNDGDNYFLGPYMFGAIIFAIFACISVYNGYFGL